jgi:hypothetical protein
VRERSSSGENLTETFSGRSDAHRFCRNILYATLSYKHFAAMRRLMRPPDRSVVTVLRLCRPDVRKGFAFPAPALLPNLRKAFPERHGKAEPYRTSGGKAAIEAAVRGLAVLAQVANLRHILLYRAA